MAQRIVTCEIKGLKELQKKLDELGKKSGRKIIKTGLKEGGAVMLEEMRRQVPKDTGFLDENLNLKMGMAGRGDDIKGTAYVGPRGKVDYPLRSGGYKTRINKKTGKPENVGRISAKSVARFLEFGVHGHQINAFMTRTFELAKEKSRDAIIKTIRDILGLS